MYSFTWDELVQHIDKPVSALKKELGYLVSKKEVYALRQNFYLIIPARYAVQGKLPISLYIDKLFHYLERPYYLAGFSAAKYLGASHQQIHKEYVVTTKPALLPISKGEMAIRFFTISNWPQANIIQKKSDAGYFNISDPMLTMADLIYHQRKLGGINRLMANLEELLEEATIAQLESLLKWYPHRSVLQRMGYIIEEIHPESELLEPLFQKINSERFYPVILSTTGSQKPGAVDNPWKVDVNIKIESDL